MSSIFHRVDVEPGDPWNDQLVARANRELNDHVGSARATLTQGGRTEATVCIAVALTEAEESMPRDRLAALLAAALVALAEAREES